MAGGSDTRFNNEQRRELLRVMDNIIQRHINFISSHKESLAKIESTDARDREALKEWTSTCERANDQVDPKGNKEYKLARAERVRERGLAVSESLGICADYMEEIELQRQEILTWLEGVHHDGDAASWLKKKSPVKTSNKTAQVCRLLGQNCQESLTGEMLPVMEKLRKTLPEITATYADLEREHADLQYQSRVLDKAQAEAAKEALGESQVYRAGDAYHGALQNSFQFMSKTPEIAATWRIMAEQIKASLAETPGHDATEDKDRER